MITLAMDTAYKNLILAIYKDDKLVDGINLEAFKKQSEEIFIQLNDLLERNHITYKDIDEIVITDGPGSYTGIRIAMTVAKVLASLQHKKLNLISTMQLYAGTKPSVNVILDARSKRVYAAHIENGKIIGKETILNMDELPAWLEENPGEIAGDAYLVNEKSAPADFLENFIALRDQYRPVKNIHALVPRYLKDSDAYKTGV